MDELVRRVRAHWIDSAEFLEAGAAAEQLAAFEAHHGIRLPPAFAALWGVANGNHGDQNLTRFWPLTEIKRLPQEDAFQHAGLPADAHDYFAFADYMIFSHLYAVRLTADGRDGPVWWVFGAKVQIEIAPTFDAFLRAYVENPDSILFPPGLGQFGEAAL